jgi:hypothetical protein
VIGALALKSALGELLRPGNVVNPNTGSGNYWAKAHCNYTKAGIDYFSESESPWNVAAFVVNSKPHTLYRSTSPRFVFAWGPGFLAVFITAD